MNPPLSRSISTDRWTSPEFDVVLDPFAGFGTVGLESIRSKRNAILIDLNPYSAFIWKTFLKKVDLASLDDKFQTVLNKAWEYAKKERLLEASCPTCKETINVDVVHHSVGDDPLQHVPQKIYFEKCPHCETPGRKGFNADKLFVNNFRRIERQRSTVLKKLGKSDTSLTWEQGRKFKEAQRYGKISDMFTTSNLMLLAEVKKNILKIDDLSIRNHLLLVLGSCIHLCTKMMPIRATRPMSGFWNVHSFYSPKSKFMESNLLRKFESAYRERQSYREAVETLWSEIYAEGFPKISIFADDIVGFKGNLGKKNTISLLALSGDSREKMQDLEKSLGRKVDYIFTDPPYNGTIQYGELLMLWNFVISDDLKAYKSTMLKGEIIESDRQGKNHQIYIASLRDAFSKMGVLLKRDSYAHVTFTNPEIKYRNATIKAGLEAGLSFQKIHYQENSMTSPKALGQPFGSIEGDFYLRFFKGAVVNATNLDDVRFRSIVRDAAIEVLAHRGQPSPFTILQNYIEPVLAKKGYFTETQSGLSIPDVLNELLGKDLKITETVFKDETGKDMKGQLWWVASEKLITKPDIPLDKRVEESITKLLLRNTSVTFTDVWKAVTLDFPNSYTPESSRIREILADCAIQADGKWIPQTNLKEYVTAHSRIIEILAKVGERSGMDIHVGLREQRDLGTNNRPLRELVTLNEKTLQQLTGSDSGRAKYVDLMWVKDGKIVSMFEVECTTSITSALERCSNIQSESRIIVIPKDRSQDLKKKLTSRMFKTAFKADQWAFAYFEDIYDLDVRRANPKDIKRLLKAG